MDCAGPFLSLSLRTFLSPPSGRIAMKVVPRAALTTAGASGCNDFHTCATRLLQANDATCADTFIAKAAAHPAAMVTRTELSKLSNEAELKRTREEAAQRRSLETKGG